jgi:hypothetical protein
MILHRLKYQDHVGMPWISQVNLVVVKHLKHIHELCSLLDYFHHICIIFRVYTMYFNDLTYFPRNPFIWIITLECSNFLYSVF